MSGRSTSREAAVLAIDLGTTDVKVGLVALDGRLLALARAGYATDVDAATGRAEQDPEAWWAAIGLAVREAMRADVGEHADVSQQVPVMEFLLLERNVLVILDVPSDIGQLFGMDLHS